MGFGLGLGVGVKSLSSFVKMNLLSVSEYNGTQIAAYLNKANGSFQTNGVSFSGRCVSGYPYVSAISNWLGGIEGAGSVALDDFFIGAFIKGTGIPTKVSLGADGVRSNSTIAELTSSGTTVVATSIMAVSVGQVVNISGANEAPFNGDFTITAIGSGNFTYEIATTTVEHATGIITGKYPGDLPAMVMEIHKDISVTGSINSGSNQFTINSGDYSQLKKGVPLYCSFSTSNAYPYILDIVDNVITLSTTSTQTVASGSIKACFVKMNVNCNSTPTTNQTYTGIANGSASYMLNNAIRINNKSTTSASKIGLISPIKASISANSLAGDNKLYINNLPVAFVGGAWSSTTNGSNIIYTKYPIDLDIGDGVYSSDTPLTIPADTYITAIDGLKVTLNNPATKDNTNIGLSYRISRSFQVGDKVIIGANGSDPTKTGIHEIASLHKVNGVVDYITTVDNLVNTFNTGASFN